MDPIVVSGAQGLLGRSILRSIQREFPGVQVIALARTAVSMKNIQTVIWDLPSQLPSSEQLPVRFHYIHTANLLKSEDPSLFNEINCNGLKKFLDQFEDQIASIIWSSSLSVLGQGPFSKAKESDHLAPETALAKSRLAQEELVMNFCKKKSVGCFGLRARLYIGGEEKEFSTYLRLILKKPFLAFNQAKTKISVISTEDYADIVCELLKKIGQDREIFNIAYKAPLSIEEYLKFYHRSPKWTLSTTLLRPVISLLPKKKGIGLQTKLELLGQDQVMDVSKLESFLGTKVLDKNPIDIISQYIKQ